MEKPNILLKKTFVRDTQFDKEDLTKDKEYEKEKLDTFVHNKRVPFDSSHMKKEKRLI